MSTINRWLTGAALVAASLVGVVSFIYPFYLPQQGSALEITSHAQDAPFLFVALIVLCLGALLADLGATHGSAKRVAILGILTAIAAALRTIQIAGFNGIFFLPILGGYVFGPTFGFLLGALSLMVSGLMGGGVGPWLPFQMFATGWAGFLSGLLPATRLHRLGRGEPAILAVWGFVLGLVFGAIMNLWFWPFVFAPQGSALYWQPGLSLADTLSRYAAFYAITSLPHDFWRAGGNFLILLLLGRPLLRVLRRFHQRFHFEVEPVLASPQQGADPNTVSP
jgi:energy-coupling factor transport system substrate-specific component